MIINPVLQALPGLVLVVDILIYVHSFILRSYSPLSGRLFFFFGELTPLQSAFISTYIY